MLSAKLQAWEAETSLIALRVTVGIPPVTGIVLVSTRGLATSGCLTSVAVVRSMSQKQCTVCREHKPLTEFAIKKGERRQSNCKACQREYSKRWYKKNESRHRANQREYKRKNRARVREAYREWSSKNKHVRAAHRAARKAAQALRTPGWADRAVIAAFYSESAQKSWEEGVDYHVDHIIPLRGARVSGLHCESNLQVITASENISKGNKFDPDLFPEQNHGYPFD